MPNAVVASENSAALEAVRWAAGKYTGQRLEAACAKAIAVGDPSYRTVKGILVAGAETEPVAPSAGDGGAAAHLHGPSQLFANVIPMPTTDAPDPVDPATTNDQPDRPDDGERRDGEGAA
jgi:hypothetical protein